jgi:acetyltransferase-like isoleucine patch superfamily enzyme
MINKIKLLTSWILLSPEEHARKMGVKIGKGCRIATRYFGSEPYLIEIGDKVQITAGVKFFNHGGGWVFRNEIPGFDTFGKIKISNNVYIGNNCLIMPGVSIGNNIIIAAGSVITKSFTEDGVIIAGNPGKIIGKVNDLKERLLPYNLDLKGLTAKEKKDYLLEQPDSVFIKK